MTCKTSSTGTLVNRLIMSKQGVLCYEG
jgi:hypothetical protein